MEQQPFKTSDLNVGAYLVSSNQVTLVKTERSSDNTVYFYFSPEATVKKLVEEYWAGKAPSIQPKTLFGARRDLQDLVFSGG